MKPLFFNFYRAFLLLVSFFVFSFTTRADPGTEKVSQEVLQRFTSSYTAAKNVTWKVTKEFSKASFTVNDQLTEVFYDRRNQLIGTAVHITLQELPAGCTDNISCYYAKYQPVSVIRYTNAFGDTSCFVQLETSKRRCIVQVDEQGQIDCVQSEKK